MSGLRTWHAAHRFHGLLRPALATLAYAVASGVAFGAAAVEFYNEALDASRGTSPSPPPPRCRCHPDQ